jgi:hypothetical protein
MRPRMAWDRMIDLSESPFRTSAVRAQHTAGLEIV